MAEELLIVSTERLGWPLPRRGWRRVFDLLPWESQTRFVYEIDPEEPTATCHLQPGPERVALCGYQWEGLIAVPGGRTWHSLGDWLKCEICEEEVAARRGGAT
ncbi:hypothetical protein GCM10009612_14390 [Streptomyces beijiangensis]